MNSNDAKIIKQLMEKGRTTWAELGALLGLSAPATAERVRKLEDNGVIKEYVAVLDPEAAGCSLAAFLLVTLEKTEERGRFLELVKNQAQIQECHHIAGEGDYLLKARCGSTKELEKLISEEIKALPGVKTKTTVVLSTVKETTKLPLS